MRRDAHVRFGKRSGKTHRWRHRQGVPDRLHFTGFGRTGRMFGFEHDGITPDIVMTSKGLGGGYVPLGAVTTTREIYASFAADPLVGGIRYGHTTSGHAVACAVALAALDVLRTEKLVESAAAHGTTLLTALTALATKVPRPLVVDVRGMGLVTVLEASSAAAAADLVRSAREHGLLLRQHGCTAMLLPPLVIDDAGVEAVLQIFEAVFATVNR